MGKSNNERQNDEYIGKQKSPQKEICSELRRIILKNFPRIKEEFKMGVPWYEDKYYIVALKDHVNLGLCVDGLSKKEMGMLKGKGKCMRHIEFFFPKDIDAKKVAGLLKMAKKGNNK